MTARDLRTAWARLRACRDARRGILWRWGRFELPVQGLLADRVYERVRRFFFSRTRSRTDALPDRTQAVNLSPPTGRSAGRTSALFVLEARGGETSRTLTD